MKSIQNVLVNRYNWAIASKRSTIKKGTKICLEQTDFKHEMMPRLNRSRRSVLDWRKDDPIIQLGD